MIVRIKYFGMVAELTGRSEEEVVFSGGSLQELLNELNNRYSGLNEFTIKPAINLELVDWNTELKEGEDVSFLPPFAGG